MIKIRLFKESDTESVARLFHETVRSINTRDYSNAQVQAWAPDDIHFRDWTACLSRSTFVAEISGVIVGFAEFEPNGHIDMFYCHKDYQRCGVGRQLYDAIEAKAIQLGVNLTTEASITAKPFFQRMGFTIVQEQNVSRRGQTFVNYKMEKTLCDQNRARSLQHDLG